MFPIQFWLRTRILLIQAVRFSAASARAERLFLTSNVVECEVALVNFAVEIKALTAKPYNADLFLYGGLEQYSGGDVSAAASSQDPKYLSLGHIEGCVDDILLDECRAFRYFQL